MSARIAANSCSPRQPDSTSEPLSRNDLHLNVGTTTHECGCNDSQGRRQTLPLRSPARSADANVPRAPGRVEPKPLAAGTRSVLPGYGWCS